MNDKAEEPTAVRNYLLGTLNNEKALRQIEETIMLSDDFAERISIAEDELIEEYLDGELSAGESEKFRRYFLAAPERKAKLRFIQNLKKHAGKIEAEEIVEEKEGKAGFFGWILSPAVLRFAVVLLLFGGIGLVVWRTVFYESNADRGLTQMTAAYRGTRPLESRSSADFGYAPFTVTRGETVSPTDSIALERAQLYLLDAARDPNDARAHHALGLFYLNKKEFDKALGEFIIALKLAPENAELHSDTGAAYLEKAEQAEAREKYDETLENLSRSLESLNRALGLNAALPEALFNKALVLEKKGVPNQAREAWQKYLETDPASEWADEARRNLERLQQTEAAPKDKSQILKDFLDAFRRRDDDKAWRIISETKEFVTGVMVQQQLAGKILEDTEQSREEQDEILSAFVYLGDLEKQNAGEFYFYDLAQYYKNISPEQKLKLSEAYGEAKKAQDFLLLPNIEQALQFFNRSKELFLQAGNIWEAQIIEYQICYGLSQIDRITESNERLAELAGFGAEKNYKWLQILAENWIGANLHTLGESSKAVAYNQRSLEISKTTADVYNIQRNFIQMSEEYRSLENSEKAFDYIFRSLSYPVSYHTFPRQSWRHLFFTAQILYSFKFYEAASVYADEEISLAENVLKDNWMKHSGLVHSGIISASLKNFEKATARLTESLTLAETFADKKMRDRLTSKSLTALGNVQRQAGNCAQAVPNYDRAIEIFETMQFAVGSYEARRGRLLCYIELRDDEAVRREMPQILQIFDENRRKIADEAVRNIFFDNEQHIYDIAANYAFSNLQNAETAFDYTENSRARSLLSLIGSDAEKAKPLTLSEIRAQMPAKVQIIYYAVLADKTLQWHISADKSQVVEIPVGQTDLADRVSAYSKNLLGRKDGGDLKREAEELYRLLIKPAETLLDKNKTLCIIADKQLFRLPFASLVSPDTGKYLLEDFQIQAAPSATVFIRETEIARQKNSVQEETLLSIGNPKFSRKDYSELADLPSAAKEAEQIASEYSRAAHKVFVGENAGKQQFTSNLPDADVIHFAGHYVPNAKFPARSKFLLANGDLPVEEISRIKLPRARLMVLSACETGIENFYNGEGMIGAARTFLASDVPIVVASTWSVDSEATAELMTKFHRYRKREGLTVTAALRQAQIALLTDGQKPFRQPFFWAGFLPIGGFVEY